MRSLFFPQRSSEASPEQLIATGAAGGFGTDPVDGDRGYRSLGVGNRDQPIWTLEKARAFSVSSYRANPMARAIIDTYTSFAVGDSGVALQCTSDEVRPFIEEFWSDPRVNMFELQSGLLRDHMLMGETALELLVGPRTGITRLSPIDPSRIRAVELFEGNPLWFDKLHFSSGLGEALSLQIAGVDDITGLRSGEVMYWPSWRALVTDRRGAPFLSPLLDSLDAYDDVMSNLIDRTALARHLAYHVTLEGESQDGVDKWVKARGGRHVPQSGTIEVTNEKVKWVPISAVVGSFEDTNTISSILTTIAAGSGLSKTWLADPHGANRATSMTMAEPVRRRVGGVQNMWLGYMTELCRFVVDQGVAAGRIPRMVTSTSSTTVEAKVAAATTVHVTGPEIAAADSQVIAQVMLNLAQALQTMVVSGVMSVEAAAIASNKAWEQFVGQPFRADLVVNPDGTNVDDVAQAAAESVSLKLRAV